MPTGFKMNPGFVARMSRDLSLIPPLKDAADAAAERARELAPTLSGDYRAGIKTAVGADAKSVFARLNATDFKSHWIEFGTSDTPAFAPLRRSVMMAAR